MGQDGILTVVTTSHATYPTTLSHLENYCDLFNHDLIDEEKQETPR